jgi:hypothetical protein
MASFVADWADGTRIVWRSVTWEEYRRFRSRIKAKPLGASLEIYEAVLLHGPPLDQVPAGVCSYIAQAVMASNPFSGNYDDVKRSLDVNRHNLASSWLVTAKALICHIFDYTFEEVDKWDADKFFERLVQAEFIAGKPLEPAKPKPQKKKSAGGDLFQQEREQSDKDRKPLTRAQQMVMDRAGGEADQSDDKPEKLKRPLTHAQKMTLDRIQKSRRGA